MKLKNISQHGLFIAPFPRVQCYINQMNCMIFILIDFRIAYEVQPQFRIQWQTESTKDFVAFFVT